MTNPHQIGRIAYRHEGEMWNAYYAASGTMEGAIFLGSISMLAVTTSAARKKTFMDLMQHFVGELIEEKTGQEVTWPGAVRAPESERSGHA